VDYSNNEMLKLLKISVTDYTVVINKGKGKRCIVAKAQPYELLPFETHTHLQD